MLFLQLINQLSSLLWTALKKANQTLLALQPHQVFLPRLSLSLFQLPDRTMLNKLDDGIPLRLNGFCSRWNGHSVLGNSFASPFFITMEAWWFGGETCQTLLTVWVWVKTWLHMLFSAAPSRRPAAVTLFSHKLTTPFLSEELYEHLSWRRWHVLLLSPPAMRPFHNTIVTVLLL